MGLVGFFNTSDGPWPSSYSCIGPESRKLVLSREIPGSARTKAGRQVGATENRARIDKPFGEGKGDKVEVGLSCPHYSLLSEVSLTKKVQSVNPKTRQEAGG